MRTTAKTVRELALEFPEATGYSKNSVSTTAVVETNHSKRPARLPTCRPTRYWTRSNWQNRQPRANRKDHDWPAEPLADLIAHINRTHHKYTREEITRLGPLLDKVCSVHGNHHAELEHVRAAFRGLARNSQLT